MQLTQSEIIQILRKRAGLNQAELGSRAFNTTVDSGRTKIKNIELGKQRVSDDDLERIAGVLDIPVIQLRPDASAPLQGGGGVLLSQQLLDMFPDLNEYLDMLENASRLEDLELIGYLSDKIADIWREGPVVSDQSRNKLTSST